MATNTKVTGGTSGDERRDTAVAGTYSGGSSTRGQSVGSAIGEGAEMARIEGSWRDEGSDGPGPRLMSASTLEGDKVVNREGDDLGEIDEIMIDVPRGRIAYAVMSAGGFLGMGSKLFAIPWSALTLDTDNKCFVLDVDKQRLQNAPGFDQDHWPSMADTQFSTEVHSYYGARPYWE